MAKGYDRAKVSLFQFLKTLYPLTVPELRSQHNKIAFDILDLDRDRNMNILNMVHLQKNIDCSCQLGQEIVKLI